MLHLKRVGLTYFVRFIVPRDRWQDVGRVVRAKNGEKREVLRTLETRDLKEAHKRRGRALEEIRKELNAQLVAAGLPPLDDSWSPSWQAEALSAREELRRASDEPRWHDPNTGEAGPSDRDLKESVLWDRVEEIGEHFGGKAARAYADIATGSVLPIRSTADRWLRDIAGTVRAQTAGQHERSLALLAEFLAGRDGADAAAVLAGMGMEAVTRRVAGEFVEWLHQTRGLHPKTISSRVSGLSAFWKWAERKGLLEGNPWAGQTVGLKKKANSLTATADRERPYEEAELVSLLRADPDAGRKWTYGAALFDLLRLGLLTGARQNELASLRRADVLSVAGECDGIQVRPDVAKTESSVRRIPLHPLAQAVIRARLASLPPSADPRAPLFPELPPGGPDQKRSWHFSKKFTDFRETVLGPDKTVDFHSLRRTFSTYLAQARAAGVSAATQDIQDDLMGHKRGALSGQVYTAKNLGWSNYVSAITGMVERGMPEAVRRALEETQGARPALPKRIFVSQRARRHLPGAKGSSQRA